MRRVDGMRHWLPVALVLGIGVFVGHSRLVVAAGHQEAFESPERTWRLAETDCRPLRVLSHERKFEGAHGGRGCESVQWSAGMGTYAYLAHAIPPARIIQELVPSVWVKSDRHGIQLMARVVFPRTLENGAPVTSFLFGDRYESPGTWRQLHLDDALSQLHRETVALRTRIGPRLDDREAYIDLLVLNLYTGLGTTSLLIDDLEVAGFSPASRTASGNPVDSGSGANIVGDDSAGTFPISTGRMPGFPSDREPNPGATTELTGVPGLSDAGAGAGVVGPDQAGRASGSTLEGNVLVADQKPLFVRAIDHRGETLSFLQSLGFNVVRLATFPTAAQIAEAERCGIWLLAPPPLGSLSTNGEPPSDRILAWFLGDQLAEAALPLVRERVNMLGQQDRVPPRPLVAHFSTTRPAWTPPHCISVWERPVLQTSFELQDYFGWLERTARESRSPAPFWASLPTEASPVLSEQIMRLGGTAPTLDADIVRWLAFASISAGARGVWFRSRNRLDGVDPGTRLRVAMVRQLNRELELIAPWAAGGTVLGEQQANHPQVRVFALKTERARLLILLRRAADQQYVAAAAAPQSVLLSLPSLPVTDRTYLVAPTGVESLPTSRGGGVRVSMPAGNLATLALLTADPLAVNYLGRTAAAIRGDVARDRWEIARQVLDETRAIEESLQADAGPLPRSPALLGEAQTLLRQAETLRDASDFGGSLRMTDGVLDRLRQVRRSRWEQTVAAFTSPIASPVCVSYSALPAHFQLAQRLRSATWGVNLLAAGEMESLEHLLQSGWKQERTRLSHTEVDVQLSLDQARVGRSSLQLRAWKTEEVPAESTAIPPLTIVSAPISVQAGQLLRIQAWVQVPRPLVPRWDGLLIYDNMSGEALAERITETQGWRELTLYRVATTTGDWRLHVALTGSGEAWVDEVSVTALGP